MAAPKIINNTLRGYVTHFVSSGLGRWDAVHDAATGTSAFTVGNVRVGVGFLSFGGGRYDIDRSFLTFDLSNLPPTGASVTSASVKITAVTIQNSVNDGTADLINLVGETTPASDSALVTGDFDQCAAVDSPTELSTGKDLSGISGTDVLTYMLNAAGLSALLGAFGGNFTVGFRENHDIQDVAPSGGGLPPTSGNNALTFQSGQLTLVEYAYPQVI